MERDLDAAKPTHVINAAGVTGRPNVDWCESHKVRAAGRRRRVLTSCRPLRAACAGQHCWRARPQAECVRSNILGALVVADAAKQRGVHVTQFGSGCIYHYNEAFPEGSGKVRLTALAALSSTPLRSPPRKLLADEDALLCPWCS